MYLTPMVYFPAGYVGFPLPGVQCRLVDDHEQTIETASTPGELRIKGPQVFSQYLNRPEATKETFDNKGWFKTGDVAEVSQDGYYKILGRNSADIIKV
jgi:long-subunit acyl-CoA synthetase (AMP-forming)